MYEQFKERAPYELLNTSKYPPEVAGRFNSFITTQFDDSLSVEMQMRSIIKWAIDNFKEMDQTYNDFTEYVVEENLNPFIQFLNDLIEYMNYFIETFDEKYQETILNKLQEWYDNGELETLINESLDTKYHEMDDRLTAQLTQTDDEIQSRGVNLMYFGAVGDGVTDDSQALQDALDFISTNNVLNARRLYIPGRKFLIDNDVLVDGNGIEITGDILHSQLIAGSNIEKSVLFSSREDRVRFPTLLDVKIEKIAIIGNGHQSDGILFAGFNRGCSIRDVRVEGFRGTQINIVGSWSFDLSYNVIRGHYEWNAQQTERTFYGFGISLGDLSKTPLNTELGQVNMPNVVGNSIQFLDTGLHWLYGSGGVITGNTFENTERRYAEIFYPKGFTLSGNYFEANKGEYGLVFGGVNIVETPFSGVVNANEFMARLEGASFDILVRNIQDSSIKNNYHSSRNERTGADIMFSSSIDDNVTYGNEIHYTNEVYTPQNINQQTNRLVKTSSDPTESTLNSTIENGSGVNGYYTVLEDGTQICRHMVEIDLTSTAIQQFEWEKRFWGSQNADRIQKFFTVEGNSAQRTEYRKTSGLVLAGGDYWNLSLGESNGAVGTIRVHLMAIGPSVEQ